MHGMCRSHTPPVWSGIALPGGASYSGRMILDYLFIIGQAASALLLFYGAFLVLMPARRRTAQVLAPSDELALAKY